jgi:hypothetical protein
MDDMRDFFRSLMNDREYKAGLVSRLKAGTESVAIRKMLLQYARGSSRDAADYARGILTEAGISLEKGGE